MIADWILKLIGDDPSQFYTEDKWPVITAFLTDLIVPYGQILLLIIPFIILWKLGKWTIKAIFFALIIGVVLAWLAWRADILILDLGQAAAFKALYGESIDERY
ncbi:MAG: hypothetical protein HYR90_01875 [Candidatus Andersenbacteria bacterium]|nr:hypothetical protein [Candidatus Andersenbacteria bacterium]MBI3250909.1 hypothetical protein [Candidatus Andersenbacteria bacterium]